MVWIEFFITAVVIVVAANKLATYGDVIGIRTNLGGMFVGTLLLSAATSLPELLTGINSIDQGVPELTVGNIFGSVMFNMAMLGILDLFYRKGRILRLVAINHSLTAALAILLIGLSIFFIEARLDVTVGWVGIDSLILMGVYLWGTNLIHNNNQSDAVVVIVPTDEQLQGLPSLRYALIGFGVATLALIVTTPFLVSSSVGIAAATGISTGFVGVALVGVITSLPEAVTTISAVRIGAFDLAVGNLFGSNVFNIFALGITDFFYTKGSFLADIDPLMAMTGQIGLVLTVLAMMGNLGRSERRFFFVELDAVALLVLYIMGMWFLYSRGLVA